MIRNVKRYYGSADENLFQEINEESAYWIGFLMADGNLVDVGRTSIIRLHLSAIDKSHILKFKDYTKSTNKLYNYKNSYQFQICSKKIGDRLKEFGVVPNKTLSAEVIQLENNRDFWRGVIDGDGSLHIRVRKNKTIENVEFPTLKLVGSEKLIIQFIDFIKSNCPKVNVKPSKLGNIFQVSIGSRIARIIIEKLYNNSNTYLDRKYLKAQEIIEKFNYESYK